MHSGSLHTCAAKIKFFEGLPQISQGYSSKPVSINRYKRSNVINKRYVQEKLFLTVDFQSLTDKYNLNDCIKCKRCTKNCSSAKHGGIVPDQVVFEVSNGTYGGDPWACLVCHRCSLVCPKKIDVAGMILELRHHEASEGNIPERFGRVYKRYLETGDTLSTTESIDAERNALGLSNIERDTEVLDKLRIISGGSQ